MQGHSLAEGWPGTWKIPARRAEYSLTGSALFPFRAEPTQTIPTPECFGRRYRQVRVDQSFKHLLFTIRISQVKLVRPDGRCRTRLPETAPTLRRWICPNWQISPASTSGQEAAYLCPSPGRLVNLFN